MRLVLVSPEEANPWSVRPFRSGNNSLELKAPSQLPMAQSKHQCLDPKRYPKHATRSSPSANSKGDSGLWVTLHGMSNLRFGAMTW